ncbi:DUF3108 domain-containing protein [Marinoscillum furvescens]|uniref:Uncharacterized protein DUF3108 n=1 Tax=Marinoscillum furvescens DSM 4134 TaxID=1122208 RepID=A0A3D9LA34_MARFU|nr:DUF3108 domain-containing protein [Marinoscillum furvescens]REE02113.1 uncharacterized protein DUF3108 [Marinoscillum furvescens DSM 4134]
MMKILNLAFFLTVLSTKVVFGQQYVNQDFALGEEIRFKISYGWFALGEASMSLGDSLVEVDGQHYYQNTIQAGTVGLFSWLAGIENSYSGLVNVDNYKTIKSEKHINDRKGKEDQWNVFDYKRMDTDVKVVKQRDGDSKLKSFTVGLTADTYDLHGTYMYLRSKLWSGFEPGDSLLLKTYWVDKLYDFGMEYGGVDKIKFDGKKVITHKFYGLFPVSGTFPKEKAVEVWILERDGMGIPVRIEAEMKIGKVRCELKEYKVRGQRLISSK